MTGAGLRLRAASAADAPALARLGRDSFVAKFGDLYHPRDLAAFLAQTYAVECVAAELADPQRLFQLAERGGQLAGFCKIGLASSWPEHARGRRAMELKQLYTDPQLTGQGIGATLMEWALAEFAARGADEIHLSVFSGNPGAQRFYARYGFVRLADIAFWVGNHRDDEFLMGRMLGA